MTTKNVNLDCCNDLSIIYIPFNPYVVNLSVTMQLPHTPVEMWMVYGRWRLYPQVRYE